MELIGHTNIFRLLGDILHLISVLIVLQKMLRMRSCTGLSLKSQFLYAVVFTTRYIPSFHWSSSLYLHVMKFFYLSTSWYIVYLMRNRLPWKASYDEKLDTFKIRFLVFPCILLAFLFHYERPHHEIVEMLWTFSQYLEAVAIIPQLTMLTTTLESGRKWELLTGHYVATLGLYRIFYILNWVYRYFMEYRWNWVDSTSGIIQTLLFSEFFLTYFRGLNEFRKEGLPLN